MKSCHASQDGALIPQQGPRCTPRSTLQGHFRVLGNGQCNKHFYIRTTGVETAVTWQVCYTLTQRPRWRLLLHQGTWAEAEPTCWDTGKVAASPWPFKNLILHLFATENHEDCTSKQPAWGHVPPSVRDKPGTRAVTVFCVMQVI